MHIIAGERRGAQLFAPRGMDTRPTQARVKESLFSIIQAYVPDARVLDLFGGSGSLALEALSRGAARADIADMDREAVACIRRNVDKLRYQGQVGIHRGEWQRTLASFRADGRVYDLVFLDPPYRLHALEACCFALADGGMLAPQAMLVLEHGADAQPTLDSRFTLYREREYGDTQIHFYLYEPPEEEA